jgi:two-component system sensor histidine kinase/response regulator
MSESSAQRPRPRLRMVVAFALPLLVVGAIVLISFNSIVSFIDSSRRIAHSHEVTARLEETLSAVEAAETAARGYAITGDESYAEECRMKLPLISHSLDRVATLTRNDVLQSPRLPDLRQAINGKLSTIHRLVDARRSGGFEAARQLTTAGAGRQAMANVRRIITGMKQEEAQHLIRRGAESESIARRTKLLLLAGGLLDVALLAALFYVIRRDQILSRNLAAQLAGARDMAIQSTRLKAEFLATMSHEIRTPMNAVIGMTGLLLDTKLDKDQRELAETVRSSADSLLAIINDILDFSKIEAGKLDVEVTDFDLRATVESVVDLMTESAQRSGVAIGALLDHELPKYLRGDAGRIRQVLTNLVSNGIKFTPSKGDVIIHVQREKETVTHVVVRFLVTDTGIGIPEEQLVRLFQPFSQADASTTRRFGGTGLGLAISKQLIDMMAGRIGVESTEGYGSTFWFVLPLEKSQQSAQVRDFEALHGLRVLIVDDTETNRRLIQFNLSAWKMESVAVASGSEALTALREAALRGRPFDLVLMDMMTPDVDGIALARMVRAEPATGSPHLVLLAPLASRPPNETLEEAGIAACLSKPIKESQLFDCVASVVGGTIGKAPEQEAETPAAAPFAGARLRILVAEDNPVNQRLALRQLQQLGVSAHAVGNGKEAVEALGRMPFDMVLMDCHMPEMDGFEATARIREFEGGYRHTPIVAMTANALAGDRERCLAAGMDDYLAKPVTKSQLTAALSRWSKHPVDDSPAPDPQVASRASIDPEMMGHLRALRTSPDDPIVSEIIDLFLEDAPPRINDMRRAFEAGDALRMARAAHALKSSCGNMGAARMTELCDELELLGRSGVTHGAAEKIAEASSELDKVRVALEAERRNGL